MDGSVSLTGYTLVLMSGARPEIGPTIEVGLECAVLLE